MRVLLINPPIREWSQPSMFPEGLGYVAASLRNAGHDIVVMDINAYRWSPAQVEEKIKEIEYDVAGTGSLVTVYKYFKWLVPVLKKYHPSKPVILGGSIASASPELIMYHLKEVDIICYGEGEITSVDLLDALEKGRDLSEVQGICYRKNGRIVKNPPRPFIKNLDTLPWPAWDLFPIEIYSQNPDGYYELVSDAKWTDGKPREDTPLTLNISGTRGCPFRCTFCHSDFTGMRYRKMSPDYILKKIQYLQDTYNVQYFQIQDDLFICDRQHTHAFADAILERGMKFEWGCNARVDLVDEELFRKIRKAGCMIAGYGLESGSQRILDIMKKGVKVEQMKIAVRLAQKYFGFCDGSFIVGMPGEDEQTIRETIDFCKELNLSPEVIFFATPYPGTELWETAMRMGKIKDIDAYLMDLGEQGAKVRVNFTNWTDEELMEINRKMVRELEAMSKKLLYYGAQNATWRG